MLTYGGCMPPFDNAQRFMILGYSGSGKSTLAESISAKRGIPLLHLDTVHWMSGWRERPEASSAAIVSAFLDGHESWVIEGNYRGMAFDRRLDSADCIIILNIDRFICLRRAFMRYRRYRHGNRPDMTIGCNDKFDAEFLWWLLCRGRSRKRARFYAHIAATYPERCIVVNTREQSSFRLP